MPLYSWYKERGNSSISGKFNSNKCTIESHNFTEEELNDLPELANFIFANTKIFFLVIFPLELMLLRIVM